jgi:hypothetical protein
MPELKGASANQQEGHQGGGNNETRQRSTTTFWNKNVGQEGPWPTGRADAQTTKNVQPGKIAARRGHFGGVTSEWHQVLVESMRGQEPG